MSFLTILLQLLYILEKLSQTGLHHGRRTPAIPPSRPQLRTQTSPPRNLVTSLFQHESISTTYPSEGGTTASGKVDHVRKEEY